MLALTSAGTLLRICSFQLARAGSQISMPMPSENDGAVGGCDGTPGPTNSLTRHMSTAAVIGAAESTAINRSPALMDLTATTEVLASGLNAVLIPSSQFSGAEEALTEATGP